MSKIENPKSQDAFIERRGRILTSVNMSPKSVALHLFPRDQSQLSVKDLKDTFGDYYEGTEIASSRDVIRGQIKRYCDYTFVPFGLVRRTFGTSTIDYSLTDEGTHYAVPAASSALDFEMKHNQSLFPILGSTHVPHSGQQRAAAHRIAVLLTLDDSQDPLTRDELTRKTGISSKTIGYAINALQKGGLIKYHAASGREGKEEFSYIRGDTFQKDITPYKEDRAFSLIVIGAIESLLKEKKPITSTSLFEELPSSLKERFPEDRVKTRLKQHISNLLRQHYLEHTKFSKSHWSETKLTQEGQIFVVEFVRVVDSLLRDDQAAHQQAENVTRRILADLPRYARRSAEIFAPYSKSVKMRQREELLQQVCETVAHHPEGITVSNIAEMLENVPTGMVGQYLNILERRGMVRTVNRRGSKVVRLSE